jgi:hypothetical protein
MELTNPKHHLTPTLIPSFGHFINYLLLLNTQLKDYSHIVEETKEIMDECKINITNLELRYKVHLQTQIELSSTNKISAFLLKPPGKIPSNLSLMEVLSYQKR